MRRSIFTLLAAAFMVLVFSATAFAVNQAFMKTTVPNIPKSTCYQAGTDTMEFDDATSMVEGDVITLTLNNKVTICKGIDMFVTFANTAGVLDVTGALPVSSTSAGAPTITAAAAGQQWGFRVVGPVGSQIITLTLNQVITATGVIAVPAGLRMTFAGAANTDKLVVKLFDGKVGVWATSGIQKYNAVTVAYDTATALNVDNILCIDTLTQDYTGEYVVNTPNSVPGIPADKLNFSGDYTIAHIMAAQTYNLVTCKGATCGHIVLGTSGQDGVCTSFDYETKGTGLNGYCTDHTATGATMLPKLIVQTSQPFDNLVNWTVSAQILVNGVAGEHGVYWSNVAPAYKTSAVTTCDTPVGAVGFAGQAYTLAGGGVAVPVAPIGTCTGVAAAAKAVMFTTTAGPLFIANQYFFELNLPPFNYNLAEVNAGDVVTVRVTMTKGTCGSISFDLCIGTFGCAAAPAGAGAMRLCPYVTSLAAGDDFWNGIAVVNTGAAAGTVVLTATKNDGTTATFTTPSIAAGGMYVRLLSDIPWVGTTPSEVPAYITVQAASTIPVGSLDAFVMMADGASNSMGYLCR